MMMPIVLQDNTVQCQVQQQIKVMQWMSGYEKFIIVSDDDVGIFQGGTRLVQVLDCQSLGGQVQVRNG